MPTPALASSGLLSTILVAVLCLAVWFDMRERRIPNWITVGGLVTALVARGVIGSGALWTGTLGAALGLSLGILLFSVGAMGAGDGKLLAAVGSILGLETFLWCLPMIGVFGGLLALAVTIRNGTVIPTLRRCRDFLFCLVSVGRLGTLSTLQTPGAVAVPYGVAVAAGAAMAWLGWGVTP